MRRLGAILVFSARLLFCYALGLDTLKEYFLFNSVVNSKFQTFQSWKDFTNFSVRDFQRILSNGRGDSKSEHSSVFSTR